MEKKLLFEISATNHEAVVAIVNAIPADKHWYIYASLEAPLWLKEIGLVEENTGFSFESGLHQAAVIGRRMKEPNPTGRCHEANICAITAHRKYPGFVQFEKAGYDDWQFSFDMARRVFVAYLRQGYFGNFSFSWKPDDEILIRLGFHDYDESRFGLNEKMKQRPTFDIAVEGDENRIMPILEAVHLAGARSCQPRV